MRVPGAARSVLRAATAAEHARLDALFGGLRLADMRDYRTLLAAQAAAHLPVEAALEAACAEQVVPDWPSRRRADLLRADLRELALGEPQPVTAPALSGSAAILGALYVLEGSRLGGRVLKAGLPPEAPCRFLAAAQPAGAWRTLLGLLDLRLSTPASLAVAAETARQVFLCFERAARRELERLPSASIQT